MAEVNLKRSASFFERARTMIPGGVNSPVRAFKSVGGTPRFIARGSGAYLWDVDGNRYLDFIASWGPLILGHAHPEVLRAVQEAMANGTSFGAPTEGEVVLAEMIINAFPGMDQVRLVNSGTEATMSAIRLARAYTGRSKVVKFAGCYHGHVDSLLVKAGSGVATLGISDSAGVSEQLSAETLVLPYNDIEALEDLFKAAGEQIATVIVEPVPGNMGLVMPKPGYLERLREVTQANGSVLIFDEVITGFRICYGGAQLCYGVTPDLTCLGKIIGGGLPVGAYGGKKEIMALIAPEGPVYQAGTLSGNPLAVAAGITTLRILKDSNPYGDLGRMTSGFVKELRTIFTEKGVPIQINQLGSMFTVFFNSEPVVDYQSAGLSDKNRYARFFHVMLEAGFYFSPGQFETGFVSTAHTNEEMEEVLMTVKRVFHVG